MAVGIVLIEGLCLGIAAFTPLPQFCPPGAWPDSPGWQPLPLALIWIPGAWAAGAMAAGVAGRRSTGWTTGAALSIPLALIAVLLDASRSELTIIALPLFAAGAGAEFTARLMQRDRARSPGSDTAL